MLGDVLQRDRIPSEVEGRFNGLACAEGVIKSDSELKSGPVGNPGFHTDHVGHMLGDLFRLDFGIAGVQKNAFDVACAQAEQLGQGRRRDGRGTAGLVLKHEALLSGAVPGKVDDLW